MLKFKPFIMFILCSSFFQYSYAEDVFFAAENPDPNNYSMVVFAEDSYDCSSVVHTEIRTPAPKNQLIYQCWFYYSCSTVTAIFTRIDDGSTCSWNSAGTTNKNYPTPCAHVGSKNIWTSPTDTTPFQTKMGKKNCGAP
ncbi:MAG: hypothetical protein V4591_04285 [Bdellovibrionota bacterium]